MERVCRQVASTGVQKTLSPDADRLIRRRGDVQQTRLMREAKAEAKDDRG
jgi:hypothetical protein